MLPEGDLAECESFLTVLELLLDEEGVMLLSLSQLLLRLRFFFLSDGSVELLPRLHQFIVQVLVARGLLQCVLYNLYVVSGSYDLDVGVSDFDPSDLDVAVGSLQVNEGVDARRYRDVATSDLLLHVLVVAGRHGTL